MILLALIITGCTQTKVIDVKRGEIPKTCDECQHSIDLRPVPYGNDVIKPSEKLSTDFQACYDKANSKYPNDNDGYNRVVQACMKAKGYK